MLVNKFSLAQQPLDTICGSSSHHFSSQSLSTLSCSLPHWASKFRLFDETWCSHLQCKVRPSTLLGDLDAWKWRQYAASKRWDPINHFRRVTSLTKGILDFLPATVSINSMNFLTVKYVFWLTVTLKNYCDISKTVSATLKGKRREWADPSLVSHWKWLCAGKFKCIFNATESSYPTTALLISTNH